MPKSTKLHPKGKSNTIQKPVKIENEDGEMDPEESSRKFQLELCWCIQQLEKSLVNKKGNEQQLQEIWKILTVLKNNNQPIIRKRQLMRTHFGDYRSKMAAEEKKLVKMASKIKISEQPTQAKATFLRKSLFSTTGDESFKFNFKLAPEQIDHGNTKHENGNTDPQGVEDGNTVNKTEASANTKPKSFKFSFTESEFKFNFVDKDNTSS